MDYDDASQKTMCRTGVGQLQQQEGSAEEHELLLHQLALEHDEDMLEEPEKGLDYFIINRIR